MRFSLTPTLSLLPLLAAPLIACQQPVPPIDPSLLADQAALHAREIVHQSGAGVGFTQDESSGLATIANGMQGAGDGLAGAMPSPMPPAMGSAMGDSPLAAAMAGMTSMLTTEEQFDDTADQLRIWLRERVLADVNRESTTDDEAIYRLRPIRPAAGSRARMIPPGTVPELNTGCVDDLTRLEVRVSLRADGDGVRLGVLIGPQRLELSAFVIHSDLLALEMDLARADAATQVIAQTLGSDGPVAVHEALAGKSASPSTRTARRR